MIEVAMQRETLTVTRAIFPAPYTLRSHEPGDERTWFDLQLATGVYGPLAADLFAREFAGDGARGQLSGRMFFVMSGAESVATGTAWHGAPLRDGRWGRLHWIAVHPAHQRRGLGLNLCRHLLAVLRDLGHSRAFLTTGSDNAPAISLYRKLGFTPWIRTPEEAMFWARDLAGDAR